MFKKAVGLLALGAAARAGYLFFTGEDITFDSMLFLNKPKGPQPIGEGLSLTSFIPYAPGAKAPGPFAPVTNIATNKGSDVTITPGDED